LSGREKGKKCAVVPLDVDVDVNVEVDVDVDDRGSITWFSLFCNGSKETKAVVTHTG